ncbi:glycoside hydrolase family 13 protein [Fusobacterium perfoetens]|uniref:glycoside hydrolase family 13 protein n=1 Tax=Fusobacterium perfoetens TaxID=852 RepID=UPI000685775C|nr:glycoside hydrolase family 13 protein [Fusobacterium perfoetens]
MVELLNLAWDDNYIFFNSQDTNYKSIFGAAPCNESVTFNIKINEKAMIDSVFIHFFIDNLDISQPPREYRYHMTCKKNLGEPDDIYTYTYKVEDKPRLVFYYFEIILKNGEFKYYGNNYDGLGGIGQVYSNNPRSYQMTTFYPDSKTPDWYKESIIYQIFPDRFFNGNPYGNLSAQKENTFIYGNWYDTPIYIKGAQGEILRWDFFGGNFKGIEKKIDYFKELGINLIYLNPIFQAASNHRYDTGDYKKVDSILGTEEDFNSLITTLKENNINVILDGVFSHTGRDSKYFNRFNHYDSVGAYNSVGSPYYDWYTFKNYPNEYVSWWGNDDLPCVNELNPSFLDYIIRDEDSVVAKWLGVGIKGWRLDVADELPGEFLKILRKRCHEIDKESILLGEVWEDATNKISYNQRREYMCGEELDTVTNYPFKKILLDFFYNKGNAEKVCKLFMNLRENYPKENFYALTNIIGSHDVERILSVCEDIGKFMQDYLYKRGLHKDKLIMKDDLVKKLGLDLLKLFSLVQLTFPGVPLIYYGDEVGLRGGKDPDNRRTYPWGRENQEILSWYKFLTRMRNKHSLLSTGDFRQFYLNEDIYGYIRFLDNGVDQFGKNRGMDNFIIVIISRNPLTSFDIDIDFSNFDDIPSVKKCKFIYELTDGKRNIPACRKLTFNIKDLGFLVISNTDICSL